MFTDVIENGHWDTSKSLVRRVLQECISLGRKYKKSGDKADQYEAFRLLGQAVSRKSTSFHTRFCPFQRLGTNRCILLSCVQLELLHLC